ncbi:FAD-dependent oxidoreductase [Rhodococcus globerulus]|uniref:FAD-dependent oxidoreductase n=1 Tax=Rhodococcus globerulus TaxID=33008 RepID=A0ABU4C447_RHOGO|nr:FAD-dependent oxidoreductase [Rhodococcus globerulus]MDV6271046.1 FAD-dependent oxidoreductase [Rhodococcus globerulus]
MRVTVIGAGSIGLCSALALASDGAQVRVVDAHAAGAGASSHNAGWVVPSMSAPVPAPGVLTQSLKWMLRPDSPLYIRPSRDPHFAKFMIQMLRNCTSTRFEAGLQNLMALNQRTFELFDEFERNGLRFENYRSGLVQLFRTQKSLDSHAHEMDLVQNLGGDDFDVLTRTEAAQLIPGISHSILGGIVCPNERFLDPAAFMKSLVTQCKNLGVEFVEATEVSLSSDAAGTITASGNDRSMTSDHFVVAAGAWSGQVVRDLGYTLPLQSGKGYGFDVPPMFPPGVRASYLSEAKVAVTPLAGATRLAGTMGFGGRGENVDMRRAGGILTSAADYFDNWDRPLNAVPWTGLRPMTPDGMPIIGPLPRHPNVTVATGHAMLGITLGPVTGELVARSVLGRGLPVYARVFGLERFRRTFAPRPRRASASNMPR